MFGMHTRVGRFGLALLATTALVLLSSRVSAEQINFQLDPALSNIANFTEFWELGYKFDPQGPDANATSYSGTISVEVDDPLAPTSIEFLGAAAAANNSGDWLPNDTVGPYPGYNEGDPDVHGDADPGAPAPANYGGVIDLRPIGIGVAYGAQRDIVWNITSNPIAVSSGQFSSRQIFGLSGQQDFSIIPNPTYPDLDDDAQQAFFDPAEDFASNDPSLVGTYFVDSELATLTLPVDLFLIVGVAEETYTGVLVATADLAPPLLGDVNLDGFVNGLDVDAFVQRVTTGQFQEEADMNQDGSVNGLDVDPFVAAVIGGGGVEGVPEPSTLLLAGIGLVVCAWFGVRHRSGAG